MKPGLLAIASDILDVTDEQAQSALAAAMKANAENFLIAGGTVSLTEWSTLSVIERKAMTDAGVAVEKDRATMLAAEILRQQLAGPGAPVSEGGP